MRIIVFSPFYPPHRGGLETHSDEFNKYLSLLGVEIAVFTPRLPLSSAQKETVHQGVSVIRFPAFEPLHNYPFPCFWRKEFWKLWRILLQEPADLVLSRTRFFFPSLMARHLAKKRRLPFVHIEHGSDFAHLGSPFKNFLGKLYDYTLGRLILRSADFLIANSEASKRFVEKLSGRKDCEVFYRGIEKELVEGAPPQTKLREQHPNSIHIGYIGRLIRGKGVHDLIAAFARIKEPLTLLVLIGDGPERKSLEALSQKLGIASQVIFLGAQPLPEAMGYLKTWDIFVNPSYTEGIPTSVIEAALLKKAIVATDVGGTREIVSGTNDGVLVNPQDSEALGQALKQLIQDSKLREGLGKEAAQKVARRFSWEETALRYQAFFEKIIIHS